MMLEPHASIMRVSSIMRIMLKSRIMRIMLESRIMRERSMI
jgi:hypothetical protein